MKVAVCIPALQDVKALFTVSAMGLVCRTVTDRPDIQIAPLLNAGMHRIEEARESLAALALKEEADWLLWLDDDHVFPPDSLLRLLAHDLDIVGANYRKRNPAVMMSASIKSGPLGTQPLKPKAEGIEAVDILGFGVCLIRADVFRKLRRPWFKWGPYNEDGYFCIEAKRFGYQPHVDHALSMEVGHIAETVLTFPR